MARVEKQQDLMMNVVEYVRKQVDQLVKVQCGGNLVATIPPSTPFRGKDGTEDNFPTTPEQRSGQKREFEN